MQGVSPVEWGMPGGAMAGGAVRGIVVRCTGTGTNRHVPNHPRRCSQRIPAPAPLPPAVRSVRCAHRRVGTRDRARRRKLRRSNRTARRTDRDATETDPDHLGTTTLPAGKTLCAMTLFSCLGGTAAASAKGVRVLKSWEIRDGAVGHPPAAISLRQLNQNGGGGKRRSDRPAETPKMPVTRPFSGQKEGTHVYFLRLFQCTRGQAPDEAWRSARVRSKAHRVG